MMKKGARHLERSRVRAWENDDLCRELYSEVLCTPQGLDSRFSMFLFSPKLRRRSTLSLMSRLAEELKSRESRPSLRARLLEICTYHGGRSIEERHAPDHGEPTHTSTSLQLLFPVRYVFLVRTRYMAQPDCVGKCRRDVRSQLN